MGKGMKIFLELKQRNKVCFNKITRNFLDVDSILKDVSRTFPKHSFF